MARIALSSVLVLSALVQLVLAALVPDGDYFIQSSDGSTLRDNSQGKAGQPTYLFPDANSNGKRVWTIKDQQTNTVTITNKDTGFNLFVKQPEEGARVTTTNSPVNTWLLIPNNDQTAFFISRTLLDLVITPSTGDFKGLVAIEYRDESDLTQLFKFIPAK